MAKVSDFFSQKNPSQKKYRFLFEGVKVREDWILFFCFFRPGGGGGGRGVGG